MPFDVIAWSEDAAQAALAKINCALLDDIYKVTDDHDYKVKERAKFLAGLIYVSNDTKTAKYAELRQPSLKVPYRSYINSTYETAGSEGIGAALLDLHANPLPLYDGEKIQAFVQNASSEPQVVVAFLANGPTSLRELEAVNPTHLITGYADQALTPGSWITCSMTWDQSLPKGKYAVVGMRVNSWITGQTIGMGIARLRLGTISTWRPGVPNSWMWADKLATWCDWPTKWPWRWPLMPEISFEHDDMPDIEILGTEYALSDHVVNLLLQKI